MKNFILSVVLIVFFCSVGSAQDCYSSNNMMQGRTVYFHYVHPQDAFYGTMGYIGGIGHRVLHGVGTVITAPFATPYNVPVRMRMYHYVPPQYIPGRLYELKPDTETNHVLPPAAPPVPEYDAVPKPSKFKRAAYAYSF